MSLRSCRKPLKYLRRSFSLFAVYFSKSPWLNNTQQLVMRNNVSKTCYLNTPYYISQIKQHHRHIFEESQRQIPANIYLSKVISRNTKNRSEICSKLTIKTPERPLYSVSTVDFEKVNVIWEVDNTSFKYHDWNIT